MSMGILLGLLLRLLLLLVLVGVLRVLGWVLLGIATLIFTPLVGRAERKADEAIDANNQAIYQRALSQWDAEHGKATEITTISSGSNSSSTDYFSSRPRIFGRPRRTDA